jgi:lipopolysaccharide transport system ATP-binding protein
MLEFPEFGLAAPPGSIIGVIAEGAPDNAGPAPEFSRHFVGGPLGPEMPRPEGGAAVIPAAALAGLDAVTKARTISRLIHLRRAGATFILLTHDEPLLERCADEIWWLRAGKLIARGDPLELLPQYRRYVAQAIRESGRGLESPVMPVLRDGDGRAVLTGIEVLGADSAPTIVWRAGESVAIRVTIRFTGDIADPVVGILIRTRVGLNVYGTNTELENIHFGPVRADDTVRITYRLKCELCGGEYVVTAASHDPDGVWHDWLEDAVAFAVSEERYTAGVANLRAQVVAEVLPRG